MTTEEKQETWKIIAKAYGTLEDKRTNKQHDIVHEGFCCAIEMATWSCEQEETMYMDLELFAPSKMYGNCHWLPTSIRMTEETDNIRCLFACFLAGMSKTDYEKLCTK